MLMFFRTDKYGFPVQHRTNQKVHFGFRTGDIVKANVPSGKFIGKHSGRITIRTRPNFLLQSANQKFDVNPKYLKIMHKADGYAYGF